VFYSIKAEVDVAKIGRRTGWSGHLST